MNQVMINHNENNEAIIRNRVTTTVISRVDDICKEIKESQRVI